MGLLTYRNRSGVPFQILAFGQNPELSIDSVPSLTVGVSATISATGFDETASAPSVTLSDGTATVSQSVTDWNSGSPIIIPVRSEGVEGEQRDALPFGANLTLSITDDSGNNVTYSTAQISPASGYQYTTLSGYSASAAGTSMADNFDGAVDGDQLLLPDATDQGAEITLNDNGTITIAGTGEHEFEYTIWDATDSTESVSVEVVINYSLIPVLRYMGQRMMRVRRARRRQ